MHLLLPTLFRDARRNRSTKLKNEYIAFSCNCLFFLYGKKIFCDETILLIFILALSMRKHFAP